MADGEDINHENWEAGRYAPTPTIIEAAMALYNGHNVEEIFKRDATVRNLSDTTEAIKEIIFNPKKKMKKRFVL